MTVVCLPEAIHDDGLDVLASRAELAIAYGADAEPLGSALARSDAVIVRSGLTVDRALLEGMPRVRVIARYGVGYDNIDVLAAAEREVPVLITAEANYRSVAEHVFALLFSLRRHLAVADRMVRDDAFGERAGLVGAEIGGSRLGVIGLGRIGARVAAIARDGFAIDVLGHDPFLSDDAISAVGARPVGLDELLATSDAVTVHVPLNDATRGLIGVEQLARMPSHAVLLQTARGGVVDEAALADALRDGVIAGAGVDVFSDEPPPAGHPLLTAPNTVLTPHSAALTEQALRRMAVDAATGVLDVLDGVDPRATDRPWRAVNLG